MQDTIQYVATPAGNTSDLIPYVEERGGRPHLISMQPFVDILSIPLLKIIPVCVLETTHALARLIPCVVTPLSPSCIFQTVTVVCAAPAVT